MKNMKESEEAKVVIAERYPDPSVEDLQLYNNLFSLPGDEVTFKEELDISNIK